LPSGVDGVRDAAAQGGVLDGVLVDVPEGPDAVSAITYGGLTNGSHLKHLLLTMFMAGLWAPFWAFSAWSAGNRSSIHYR
jgi:hypothetical protein